MLRVRAPVKFGSSGRANGSHPQGEVLAEILTEDAILNGRIRIRQPAKGYRVNVDTVLLAAAVEVAPGARLMEAGCGVAAALMAVASRSPETRFVGVERDAFAVSLARENVLLNDFTERVEIIEGEALDRNAMWGVFDGVFFNPPFDNEGEGREPAPARRAAHIADAPIQMWITALADRLTGGAALTLIHRAGKLPEILGALEGRLGGVEVIPIRARESEPAKRVLVRARKGARAPLKLYRGIDLHDSSGAKHSPRAEAILRGEDLITWGD